MIVVELDCIFVEITQLKYLDFIKQKINIQKEYICVHIHAMIPISYIIKLQDLTQYQTRCQEFQATEVNLRNQISMYNDKYDEFQKALTRSNEVFSGFKTEMEKVKCVVI